MNQGPRRISLIEKKEGQKSRGTIPLSKFENLSKYVAMPYKQTSEMLQKTN